MFLEKYNRYLIRMSSTLSVITSTGKTVTLMLSLLHSSEESIKYQLMSYTVVKDNIFYDDFY
jgi:hypothetical protein